MTPTPVTVRSLLELAQTVVAAGAVLAFERLRNERTLDVKSSDTDWVTDADRSVEDLVTSMILAVRPEDSVTGEESAARVGTSDVHWFIDPIDGTTNYVYRHPIWSVSVGAEVNGHRMVGVVAIPALGETYHAAHGEGAFRNGERIGVSSESRLSHALVGTGFSYSPVARGRQARLLAELLPELRDIRRDGSAAASLCFVADGRFDAFYEDGLPNWDVCAGSLIATEAGATVSRLAGEQGTYCAANPMIFGQLTRRLVELNARGE